MKTQKNAKKELKFSSEEGTMKNLIYFPWCEEERKEMGEDYKKGLLPFLDIELTAKCSLGTCIYCDSPINQKYKELNKEEFFILANDALKKGLKWIYFCGLGEPTDCEYFDEVLDFCIKNKIKLSFFCNGQRLTNELIDKLNIANASMLLKFDSMDENIFDQLLGRKGAASKIYEVVSYMKKIGFPKVRKIGNQTVTNLAFSIVPTSKNYDEILKIVKYAVSNGIFPSIGELEYAHKGKTQYEVLHVNRDKLQKLKKEISKIIGENYQRPVCPAALYSLHVNVNGNCVVDSETGISCPWFKLGDPHYSSIGEVRKDSIDKLMGDMNSYRIERMDSIRKMKTHPKTSNTFSGCGGHIEEIKKLCRDSFVPENMKKDLMKNSVEMKLMQGKRLLVLPLDHPVGEDTPVLARKGVVNMIKEVNNLSQDAYILHSRDFPQPPKGIDIPFFLTVGEQPDNYKFPLEKLYKYPNIKQVSIYFQVKDKKDVSAIEFYKDYVSRLKSKNIKVLGMGFPKNVEKCDFFQHIADLAHEIGCDYFKTALSKQLPKLELYGMPLFIGGGPYMKDKEFLKFLKEAKKISHANLSIGRNVFEHKNPSERINLIRQTIDN